MTGSSNDGKLATLWLRVRHLASWTSVCMAGEPEWQRRCEPMACLPLLSLFICESRVKREMREDNLLSRPMD